MRITCPHCGRPAKIRTSRAITATTREAYLQCENMECCHVWKVLISAVGTIVPSMVPNPEVFIPKSARLRPAQHQPSLFE